MNEISPSNLNTIPHVPGIYFFKDVNGQVIYIGKAKDLNRRVKSYFQKIVLDPKTVALVHEAKQFDYLPLRTEIEALLLEASVIMQYQPRFNIMYKEGQPFLYLCVTNQSIPQLTIVRNKKSKGTFFGPFINKQEARRVHLFLIRTFKLYICNKQLENGCLDYHLGLCAGMCRSDFDRQSYLFRLERARQLIKGEYTLLKQEIFDQIAQHNKELAFEKSKYLSELLSSIASIISTVKVHFDDKKFLPDVTLKTAPVHYKTEKDPHIGKKLQALFGLHITPSSIDCFDISHFQSRAMVGSCIRFVDSIPDKNNFRRFKIRTLIQQDDYAALQEIVRRRYRDQENLPDLILIDGGKGQRNAIKDIFPNNDVISLAKREERIFSDTYPEGIVLDPKTDVGQLLIALRDYAHHFAITYHRKKRTW